MPGEGQGTVSTTPAPTGGNLATAMEKVYRKVGTIFHRLSDGEQDYIDADDPTGSSISWSSNFVRKFAVKAATAFLDGDTIQDSEQSSIYFISNMKNSYLLDQITNKMGLMVLCNATINVSRASGQRDADMEWTESFNSVASGVLGCITTQRLALLEGRAMFVDTESRYLYIPDRYNIEVMDRITVNGANLMAETIDDFNMTGCKVVKLKEDTR